MNPITVRRIGTWAAALGLASGAVITMAAAAESDCQSIRGDHVLALRFVSGGAGSRLDVDVPDSDEEDLVAWMPRIVYQDGPLTRRTESVVRILCGAAGPYSDSAGNVWSADRSFRGGNALHHALEAVPGADDPALYRRGRAGRDFTYDIPVEQGLYAVRLKFVEPEYEALCARPFHVEINGREVLHNFDIGQAARGFRRAHDRVFRYVVPNAEGRIVLQFSGGFEPGPETENTAGARRAPMALVQAIEILPENKQAVRIACGSATDFVDWNSLLWSRDRDALQGQTIRATQPLTQATPTRYDPALYQTARCGRDILYRLSLPPALYDVHLKFAELWLTEAGRRPLDIEINGRPVWQGWDPAAAAGQCGLAIDLRTSNVTPDQAERITIRVRAVGEQDAILQGIEVE